MSRFFPFFLSPKTLSVVPSEKYLVLKEKKNENNVSKAVGNPWLCHKELTTARPIAAVRQGILVEVPIGLPSFHSFC